MKIIEGFGKMNPKMQSIIMISVLVIIGIIIGYLISSAASPYLIDNIEQKPHHNWGENENLTQIQKDHIISGFSISIIIFTVEICLLIGLISIYVNIYTKTKSKYLMGFVIFVGIFLIKSIAQLISMTPLFTESLRAGPNVITPLMKNNFGPFGIFFTIFEIIAICILLHISNE
ncbi:MAG: hypothetical protein DRN27_02035 [Thermoplasmata archaeon]|nr:MAG: hypothetical protein DRN27_02035 [Thermoplasmata archaeon]